MRLFVFAFTFAMLTTASAQYAPLPRTGNLVNNATKEVIGTVTFSGNRASVSYTHLTLPTILRV